MQAKDIMSRKVEYVSPETPVLEAAQTMKSADIGFLPVCENDRIAGAVTDRDLVLRVIAERIDFRTCKVRDVMTEDAFWCYEDQTVDEIADYMADKEVHRVLILNRDRI